MPSVGLLRPYNVLTVCPLRTNLEGAGARHVAGDAQHIEAVALERMAAAPGEREVGGQLAQQGAHLQG